MDSSTNTCACTKNLSIFWPPNHIYSGSHLLENTDQFCASFFHVLPCWELNIEKHVCLRDDPMKCKHKNVAIVMRIIDKNGATLKAKRYTNCITRGRRPIHAEEFIVKDKELLIENTNMIMYTQLQPCHHSGGSDADTLDPRSCTELLLKWIDKELMPRNINLTIRCANIYKAMWEFPPEKQHGMPLHKIFLKSSDKAREGIKLLMNSNIDVTVIDEDGWSFLKTLVRNNKYLGTEEQWSIRKDLDIKLQDFLETLE